MIGSKVWLLKCLPQVPPFLTKQMPLGGILLQRPLTRIAPIKLNNGV
jgi:hypothetical protein